ncbi:MAG: carbohydrate ABC transporter permease [Anaerolineae bacterium]
MRLSQKKLRKTIRGVVFYTVLVILLIVFLFPIAYALITSFKPPVLAESPIPYIIFKPTLNNYRTLFIQEDYERFFLNSIVISVVTVVLSLLVGVPAAYSLSRRRFKGQGWVMLWVLSSRILPPVGTIIPFYLAFIKLGLIDTHIGLIIVFLTFNISLVVWIMAAFFDQIPRELDEAAIIDGCSVTGAFTRVVLPLTAPGLATTAIFCFLNAWNNFFYPLVLTRRQAATVPLALTTFLGSYLVDWGAIMAGASLLILPLLIFALLVRRYIVEGLTQGALKG